MKRGPIARAILILFFAGLIAVPVVLTRRASQDKANAARLNEKSALARYGFYFTNDTKKAGIDFVHQEPVLDKKLAAIMPEVASLGASVSIVDYNDDGWPDIYVTTSRVGGMNALYRHNALPLLRPYRCLWIGDHEKDKELVFRPCDWRHLREPRLVNNP